MPVLKLEHRQRGLSQSANKIGDLLLKVEDIVSTTERRNSLSQEEGERLAAEIRARQAAADAAWEQECAQRELRRATRERQLKDEYKATAYYNLAFFKLGPMDPGSLDALKIRQEDRRLVGTHAFMPESPAQNSGWLVSFYPQGGYGNALRYYLTHPAVTARVLWGDLKDEAPQIRAINLGNYERSTGKRYCTLSTSFGWYSEAKAWLYRHAPWHVFLLVPLAAWVIGRKPILYAVLAAGGYEFAVASLADACETYRHLLVFHLSYDVLIVLAIMEYWEQRRQ